MREAITLTVSNERISADSSEKSPNGTTSHDARVLEHSESGTPENTDARPLHAENPEPSTPDTPTFAELGTDDRIVRALGEAGIEHTFAIQELTLPLALGGEDLIGQARTGMGKTLGFGVPLLQRLQVPGDGTPQALVVVPTRELCVQVTRDLEEAAKHLGIRTLAVYGGRPYEPQIEALRKGVDLVIGTPGRLLDLADQQHLVLGKVGGLVLDEADEMLDLGFLPDIERMLGMVPEQRQTMLFSATMPGPIINLARTFLQQPTHIRAEQADEGAVHERTRQFVYRAHAMDKTELLARALQARDRGLTMIFSRTKRTAQKLSDELNERGFAAGSVHGDLGQTAREKALRAFRSGKIDTLVATDVAARGIDVEGVTHVINLQCPDDEKTYVHRIGRTGRAGRTGVALTLVDWEEEARWKMINDALGLGLPQPVETYSTSEHLYTDLDVPSDVTGRLPLSQRDRAGLDAESEADTESPRKRSRKRTRGGSGSKRTGSDSGESSRGEPSGDTRPTGRRRRRRTRVGAGTDGAAQPAEAPSTQGAQNSRDGAERPARRRRRRGGPKRAGGNAPADSTPAGSTEGVAE
ncbi:superfamily II DNA/RNA helicase [Halopolyspora algeriensis]|uniref:RNA helicase n=1 Tax=Halopolyspora algeriensis TaxID=1500506 RepID=A0A368VMR0_9ACTN|nr:DEAD/DEAH box helicase [Halopolyspora algeriensis]RCW42818.1 superfamily II DNA/RNA helicase [Halopolyspora algeriensis]TQM56712.1 superfamily II DNA/RNA helicase [Halopolyspora algeriensis]